MEKEIKQLKAELKDIKSIQPNDNLNYLVNMISYGNITTSDDKTVLNILNRIDLGIKNLKAKNNKLIERKKKKDVSK